MSRSAPTGWVSAVKLSGFILSGAIAGVAGGLLVLIYRTVGEGSGTFQPIDGITVFSTAVIGGLGSVSGAIVGVLLFRYFETLTFLGEAKQLITGAGLLLVLLFLPGGLGQVLFGVRDRYLRFVANRRGILVPSLVADKRASGADDDHSADEVDLLRGALASEPEPVGAGR